MQQVLQQCVLRESGRDKHERDELAGAGFLVRVRVRFKRDAKHIPRLLLLSSKGNDSSSTSLSR